MEENFNKVTVSKFVHSDKENDRVNQLLKEYEESMDLEKRIQLDSKQQIAKSSYLLQNSWRKWLHQKGKGFLVDFDQQERNKLKAFFNTLDKKKLGYIGIDEMEEMLMGLGLAETNEEVKRLVGTIDEDQSGKIEFEEFIHMIQDDSQENEGVVSFFKQLIFEQMADKESKEKQSLLAKLNYAKTVNASNSKKEIFKSKMPFEMIVSQIRRNHILASMNIGRCKSSGSLRAMEKIDKGKGVVKALQKMEERRIMRNLRENAIQQMNLNEGEPSILKGKN